MAEQNWWSRVTSYCRENPTLTTDGVFADLNVPNNLRKKLKAAVYQANRKPRKKPSTAGAALRKFNAVRTNLKAKGVIPGGNGSDKPFRFDMLLDDRGVEVFIGNGTRKSAIGTIELSPTGITFVRGKALKSTEREIPWDLLTSLQGFASKVGG